MVGYVLQHDHLLPHLTVRETLRYAGYLRLPPSLTRQRKLQIVRRSPERVLCACAVVRVSCGTVLMRYVWRCRWRR